MDANLDGEDTTQVGQYAPNELGLYDTAGNVWEWCHDWYAADYYENSPADNPKGPEKGKYRVLRGGAFYLNRRIVRCAGRFRYNPAYQDGNYGFRVALSPSF